MKVAGRVTTVTSVGRVVRTYHFLIFADIGLTKLLFTVLNDLYEPGCPCKYLESRCERGSIQKSYNAEAQIHRQQRRKQKMRVCRRSSVLWRSETS